MINRIFRYKRIWLLLLAPLGWLLTLAAAANPSLAEGYATRIYPIFANSFGWLLSLLPFSVLEILVLLGGLALLFYIGWTIGLVIARKERRKNRLWRLFLNLAAGASVVYLGFVLFMGINYHRASITDYLELSVQESTKEELYDLCELLIYDCNFYRKQIGEDRLGVACYDQSLKETTEGVRKAYRALEEEIPVLQAADIRNKPLLTSRLFSMALTTGIYIPFESGINIDVPEHTIPATMAHELTHFRGFMREDEANFIAYLACQKSEYAGVKYSGSLLAFDYALTALYREDKALAQKIAKLCDEAVIRDINAESAYWKPYRNTVVSNTTGAVYEQYLQSNGQESGTKSYGEMIDLLLAYYRNFNET